MSNTSNMTFIDHLEELRWRIIKSLIGILLGSAIIFFFIDEIFQILLHPTTLLDSPPTLQVLKVHGMIMIKWGIAFIGGLILGIPVITFQLWKFIAPGLLKNERKYVFPIVLFSFISFIAGVLFAYFIIIPFSLNFFSSMGYVDVENNFSINYYFSYILWLIFSSGLLFQLPVLVVIFTLIGILTPPFMRHYRRHSFITILILSALITPPDPISLLMMSLPLILLYELSIILCSIFKR